MFGVVPPDEGFFAAHIDDIDDELVEDGPHGRYASVEVKMMDPVKVATLGTIVGAGSYDDLVDKMTDSARDAASGECGLFPVPDAIRDGVVQIEDVDEVVRRWLTTDELRLDQWTNEDTRRLLDELVSLAREAQREGKHLFVWWSL